MRGDPIGILIYCTGTGAKLKKFFKIYGTVPYRTVPVNSKFFFKNYKITQLLCARVRLCTSTPGMCIRSVLLYSRLDYYEYKSTSTSVWKKAFHRERRDSL